jgi:TRAP-type C4-dicarboxylate transport system substrate-binding protein
MQETNMWSASWHVLLHIRRAYVLACCACLALVVPMAAAVAATDVSVRVATAYAADNFQTMNLQRYADDVAEATGGRVHMTIHPAGTLIRPAEIFDGVRQGRAEAGEVILSSLAKTDALFGLDALPFIVSDYEDALSMWRVSRPAIERAFAERGLQLLYAVPWPPQNLYARQPISGILDFRGRRMRTYNPATERIAELVGAHPVKLEVMDLANAIADGKLDLMITSSWTGVETKAWSGLPHYYRVSAWIPKNAVFISRKIFDRFDGATQKNLIEAARVAEERGWKMSRESDRQYETQLAANRVEVSNIDPFMRRYLDRLGENLAREWLKQAGTEELKVLLQYTSERSQRAASKSGS